MPIRARISLRVFLLACIICSVSAGLAGRFYLARQDQPGDGTLLFRGCPVNGCSITFFRSKPAGVDEYGGYARTSGRFSLGCDDYRKPLTGPLPTGTYRVCLGRPESDPSFDKYLDDNGIFYDLVIKQNGTRRYALGDITIVMDE